MKNGNKINFVAARTTLCRQKLIFACQKKFLENVCERTNFVLRLKKNKNKNASNRILVNRNCMSSIFSTKSCYFLFMTIHRASCQNKRNLFKNSLSSFYQNVRILNDKYFFIDLVYGIVRLAFFGLWITNEWLDSPKQCIGIDFFQRLN